MDRFHTASSCDSIAMLSNSNAVSVFRTQPTVLYVIDCR